jgi:hypothetical protein
MEKEISLALACFQLQVSYDRGRRMLFTGALVGRQHKGRWLVNAESVERAQREQEPQMASAATA